MSVMKCALAHLLASFAVLVASTAAADDEIRNGIDQTPSKIEAERPIPDAVEPLVKEVKKLRPKPYRCDSTGEHPRRAMIDDTNETQEICSCQTCQRWAFSTMQTLSFPLKSRTAPETLKQVERIFLGRSFDGYAYEQEQKLKAQELGVFREWIEHRYGRNAIWPERCALTEKPSEKSLFTSSQMLALCSCENCQSWASKTLRTIGRRVASPLADGKRDEALDALEAIIEETRNSGRDARAKTEHPKWLTEIFASSRREFGCDLSNKHPETVLMDDDAGEPTKLCQCDSCQRWASKSLPVLNAAVLSAKRGDTDGALRMLKASIHMSDADYGAMEISQMEKAGELGVLEEWIEYKYGKSALWPDRCSVTNLPSDKALMRTGRPLCECENCQKWALTTLRELHVRVINPFRAREKEKALAALNEIAK